MSAPFKTVPAVIGVCPICGERSEPCDPDPEAKRSLHRPTLVHFEEQHQKLHDVQDLIIKAVAAGHKVSLACTAMEPDNIRYKPVCTCGWTGKEGPTWQAEKGAETHQREVLRL